MATYWTSPLPSRPGLERRWGEDGLGVQVLLSRACPAADPLAGDLAHLAASPEARPLGLLEVGRAFESIWVVESLPPGAIALTALLEAARAARRPVPLDLCLWLAQRLCEQLARAGEPHQRLWPEQIFLVAGEPHLVGWRWAKKLPAPEEARLYLPFTPFGDGRDDAYSAAAVACAMATLSPPTPAAWTALPAPVRTLLLRASDGRGSPGTVGPAQLARDIFEALGAWGRHPDATTMGRFAEQLNVSAPLRIEQDGSHFSLTAVELAEYEEPWRPASDAPALRADGRIEGDLRPRAASGATAATPTAAQAASEEPLDLDPEALAHARPLGTCAPPPPKMMKRVTLAGIGVALLVAIAALVVARITPTWRPPKQGAMLRVDSEPPGAEVWLGSELLGQTPYVGDNDHPPGNFALRLMLKGYKPYAARFDGGRDTRLTARLIPVAAAGP